MCVVKVVLSKALILTDKGAHINQEKYCENNVMIKSEANEQV